MAKDPFTLSGMKSLNIDPFASEKKKAKKRQLTHAQKIWCWENNPHICYICGKRVNKLSDAEFDHVKAYSKGGATNLSNVKIVHRQCNRLKGTKSLSEIRKLLGIKSKKKTGKRTTKKTSVKRKTTKKKTTKSKASNPFEIKLPKFKF